MSFSFAMSLLLLSEWDRKLFLHARVVDRDLFFRTASNVFPNAIVHTFDASCRYHYHTSDSITNALAACEAGATIQGARGVAILEDKICIITGGAGSIGAATARAFLAEGAKVMLVDLRQTDLDQTTRDLDPERVAAFVADVSRAEQVRACIDATVSLWGAIDIVFSNAGNFGTVAPIESYPEDVFESVYAVHVKGAFLMCKYAVPRMRDGGSIVITSSVAGATGDPGVYAYITAKHAQVGLMRCLAKELAPRRIRVNTLHPGPVDNRFQRDVERDLGKMIHRDAARFFDEMIPLGRHARADEIAQSVLYLASDRSSFTTGATLMVDGGMSV
jgi:NAD(P)-dependent dehydrogenase (short-subunit alcohol dehydrogenase family)